METTVGADCTVLLMAMMIYDDVDDDVDVDVDIDDDDVQ